MNEQEAIEYLEEWYLTVPGNKEVSCRVKNHNEAMDTAIAALKEVQEYHATGRTPDMVRGLIGGYNRARKQCVELQKRLKKYEELEKYVVLEVAVEKKMPKKVREIDGMLVCPDCETYVGVKGCLEHQYCPECGQKVSV